MKAARAWGAKPTDFLEGWSERDRALAVGLTALEEATTQHGNPVDLAMDSDTEGWWAVKQVMDQEAAAEERYREQHPDLPPGTRLVVKYAKGDPELEELLDD